MKNRIITIGCQIGSGGRTIGKQAAKTWNSMLRLRAERIVKLYGENKISPEKRLNGKDKRRSAYYHFYTDIDWGDVHNYHIAPNRVVIGIDICVNIISELY